MASEPKTKKTKASTGEFLSTVADEQRRTDCERVVALMQKATGEAPTMWGEAIIGFGLHRQIYANGTTGDWPVIAFSPRKTDLTLYLKPEFAEREPLLAKLGRHRVGKTCVYLKRLSDVDVSVLEQLIDASVRGMESQRVRK